MQIVVDRLVAELTPASLEIVRVPVERTVPDGNRGVILTLSASTLDLGGCERLLPDPAVGLRVSPLVVGELGQ